MSKSVQWIKRFLSQLICTVTADLASAVIWWVDLAIMQAELPNLIIILLKLSLIPVSSSRLRKVFWWMAQVVIHWHRWLYTYCNYSYKLQGPGQTLS